MKVNFNQDLKKFDGSSIKRIERIQCPNCGFISGGPDKIISDETTLKFVAQESLLAVLQEDKITGEEKAKRWLLGTRIETNPENIDLTTDEISLIKQLIGKSYGSLIVGPAWKMLEGKGE